MMATADEDAAADDNDGGRCEIAIKPHTYFTYHNAT